MRLLDLRCRSFSLGCGIGYGYLHRIPTRPALPDASRADVGPVKDPAQDPAPTATPQPAADAGQRTIAAVLEIYFLRVILLLVDCRCARRAGSGGDDARLARRGSCG